VGTIPQTIGAKHQQRRTDHALYQRPQPLVRGRVAPVQVLKDEEEWLLPTRLEPQLRE
jgi:hypothetical protein